MKLLRYEPAGQERPGLLEENGVVRDLSSVCDDIDLVSDPGLIDHLRAIDVATLPAIPQPGRIGPPLARTPKFIAIGLNYADHAKESNLPSLSSCWLARRSSRSNVQQDLERLRGPPEKG